VGGDQAKYAYAYVAASTEGKRDRNLKQILGDDRRGRRGWKLASEMGAPHSGVFFQDLDSPCGVVVCRPKSDPYFELERKRRSERRQQLTTRTRSGDYEGGVSRADISPAKFFNQ
jgi:hypothetical protein